MVNTPTEKMTLESQVNTESVPKPLAANTHYPPEDKQEINHSLATTLQTSPSDLTPPFFEPTIRNLPQLFGFQHATRAINHFEGSLTTFFPL